MSQMGRWIVENNTNLAKEYGKCISENKLVKRVL
jgi:hypothetical protein